MQGEIAKAGDAAQPVVARSAESVREMSDQALGKAREQIDERSTQVGQQMRSVADAARQVGQPAQRAGAGAAGASRRRRRRARRPPRRLSRGTDANSLLDEVERLGRRSPAALLAGGVAVGILVARFLKASSENRAPGAVAASRLDRAGRRPRRPLPPPEPARRAWPARRAPRARPCPASRSERGGPR